MLVPKLRLHNESEPENRHCTCKYYVWDTEKNDFLESKVFLSTNRKKNVRKQLTGSTVSASLKFHKEDFYELLHRGYAV